MQGLPLGVSSGVPTEVKLSVWRPETVAERMARETKRLDEYISCFGEPLMYGEEIQVWSRKASSRDVPRSGDGFNWFVDWPMLPAA